MQLTKKRRVSGAMAGFLVVLCGLVLALARTSAGASNPRNYSIEPKTGGPFLRGRKVALPQAAAMVGFNIPRPDDPLASDKRISDVWVDTASGTEQLQIDYDSGLYVHVGPANRGMTNPVAAGGQYLAEAAQDATQNGGASQVIDVHGIPAYLVPEGSVLYANGLSQGGPGMVELVIGNKVVEVVGHFSNEELIRVAASASARPS
jgi:hypothetical protein